MKTTIILVTLFLTSLTFAAIPPTAMPEPSQVFEGIDREGVRGVIRTALPAVKDCFADTREAQPNVEGKVVIRFVVDDTGKVTDTIVKSTEAKYPPLENCVMQVIRGQKFPKPDKGSRAQVDYPFVFGYDKNLSVTSSN